MRVGADVGWKRSDFSRPGARPEQLAFDLGRHYRVSSPVLLTTGAHSPPLFAPVVARIAAALPDAQLHAFPDAGHIPHVTHPDSYIAAIAEFIGTNPT